jgi:hypothetical protein
LLSCRQEQSLRALDAQPELLGTCMARRVARVCLDAAEYRWKTTGTNMQMTLLHRDMISHVAKALYASSLVVIAGLKVGAGSQEIQGILVWRREFASQCTEAIFGGVYVDMTSPVEHASFNLSIASVPCVGRRYLRRVCKGSVLSSRLRCQ